MNHRITLESPARFFRPAALRRSSSPEHVAPAIDAAARRRPRRGRSARCSAPPTWDDFVAPLEDANERIGRAWGQVAHLHAVLDSPELREAYNANLPKITQYWTELGQNQALFEKYKALRASPEFAALVGRAGRRSSRTRCATSASAAPSCRRRRSRATPRSRRSSRSSRAKFSENVLDATNAFSIVVDAKRIARHPGGRAAGGARSGRRRTARQGWKFTLHAPSYLPVMQYADDRSLRETMYRESATRASEFGKPEWDNTPLIARIVELRRELAQLLGYRELRRSVARAEDGRVAAAGARVPRRPRAARAARSPRRTSRSCATSRGDELGIDELAGLGRRLCLGEAARSSATRSPTRK